MFSTCVGDRLNVILVITVQRVIFLSEKDGVVQVVLRFERRVVRHVVAVQLVRQWWSIHPVAARLPKRQAAIVVVQCVDGRLHNN